MSGNPDPPPFAPFPVIATHRIYDSRWCALRRDQVRVDNGSLQDYHVFEVSEAVCVVPVLGDGSLVLVWQYRHPHGRTHWEIPAGRMQPEETPETAAERELLEETGYRAASRERVAGFYPINGISPHYAHVFVAHDCTQVRATAHDPTERMSVHVLPSEEVRARLLRGEIEDGFSALALLYYFARASSPKSSRRKRA